MKKGRFEPLTFYLGAVTAAGVAVVVLHARYFGVADSLPELRLFFLLGLFTVAGELLPIRVKRRDQESAITVSTTFSFALLLILGPLAAATAQGTASLIDDVRHRKSFSKIVFNVAQYCLSLHAAGLVLRGLAPTSSTGGLHAFEANLLPAIFLSGITFFLVNSTLIRVAITLAQRIALRSVFRLIGPELAFSGLVDAMLMALSPIVMVASSESLFLIPLLLLPLVAVHRSASISLEKDRLVKSLQVQSDENEYQATHDALTGLPNRLLFHDRLQQAILGSNRTGAAVAVMLMDLDRFKEINDALGHQTGDMLLTEIASRLQGVLRDVDTVGRLGGDEFAVVAPDIGNPHQAAMVAERIRSVFSDPFILHGMHLHVDASLGLALHPEQGHTAEILMQRADVAMYHAKSSRTGYEFYSPEHDHHSPARLAMVDELKQAIADGGLVVHYQPKVDLADGSLIGVEALVRWEHPRLGLVPPMEFIELAEQAGLIGPLTTRVLDLALEQCSEWRKDGLDLNVAVNLSLQSLLNMEFPTAVGELLDKWQVPPSALILEITESCMMADPARTMKILNRLHEMEVELSIDDFGTGYSSLAYLRRLPVSEIKIDKSFVLDMVEDEGSAVIAQSTITLGKNLGLKVVAEGVASQEIFDRLKILGCHVAQGFHIARPLEADALTRFIEEGEYPVTRGAGNLLAHPSSVTARATR
ncbi:MAG: EAL domain-containing protein [Actinomycetota bacterium]|nr:EAL domain-containing protein [Actinomycetota bacterium]